MFKNELEIDVGRCLAALLKKKKFIGLITILFFIAGLGLTLNVGEDEYTAVATVYAAADGSYADATNAVTAMNAYLNVANSHKVSQRAALIIGRSDVSASDVQGAVSVNSSSTKSSSSSAISSFMNISATIISFSATTNDPALSMEMADAMAQSYAIEMSDILNTDSVKTLDNAYTYTMSKNATVDAWKKRILAMAAGFVFACAIVVLCEIFDRKVRTVREASVRESIPVIGLIPDYKE
ncbi:Wzz/FepE/Etk N-terminal domain-containing protein [Pseudobutyrivibrio xylanivorans]|uniref:Capsular polysaccharide biosynthesis protein n=1 Tax=Pseudobutyrivibrio xylanivorans DSM 14809 TaxID=1123012 RepID=A0A1M6IGR3_PSEXY|nr:Wzz/FepE/Etk N-terminal domain-containing protein [Pseudobutyrivibrio xylanivorans]SHJ33622.1 Capsular polysaccharide biosynthesis protein [Pseudobutyrivibrio xylanivorans DSM 14809]